MRTLSRYISILFFKNFLFSALALCLLHFFQDIVAKLIDREFPATQIFYHSALQIPEIFVQMAPPSVMLATVLTLTGLNRTSELVAIYSIGVSLTQLVMILFSLVVVICCTSLVVQDRIMPRFLKKKVTYYWQVMKKRDDFFFDFRQNKIWYRSKNMIYNLKTYDRKTSSILGMSVYTFNQGFKLAEMVEAQKASFEGKTWRLFDGTVTRIDTDSGSPTTETFKEKNFTISETPRDFQEIEKEVDGLRLKELYSYIQRVRLTGADTKGHEVKFHSRISLSFIPLIMCLLAIPFSVGNRRDGGLAKNLGLGLLTTFTYWLLYSISLSLGTNGVLPPVVAAWLPTGFFLFAALGLIALRRKS